MRQCRAEHLEQRVLILVKYHFTERGDFLGQFSLLYHPVCGQMRNAMRNGRQVHEGFLYGVLVILELTPELKLSLPLIPECRDQRRLEESLGPPETGVMVGSLPVGAGNQSWVLWNNSKSSELLSHPPQCQCLKLLTIKCYFISVVSHITRTLAKPGRDNAILAFLLITIAEVDTVLSSAQFNKPSLKTYHQQVNRTVCSELVPFPCP
ncbi:hypothetical protein STEG23_008599 [Scotinomys teguina]